VDRLELPGHDVGIHGPHWLPDGQRLTVFRSLPESKESLWIASGDGSHAEELLASSSSFLPGEGFPVSPDGRTVVYSARSGSNFQLFEFDLVTRQSHQLTSTPGDKYSGSWSPDGRWLVYSSNASGTVQLWKIGASGGEPEQLTRGDDRIRHVFYSPDGRWLYYQPNHQNIYRVPARGGPSTAGYSLPRVWTFCRRPNHLT
jgi:TolB protein